MADVRKVIFHRELFKVVSTDAWVIEFSIIGPRFFYEKVHRIFRIEYLL